MCLLTGPATVTPTGTAKPSCTDDENPTRLFPLVPFRTTLAFYIANKNLLTCFRNFSAIKGVTNIGI
jgi:hypothetical protein